MRYGIIVTFFILFWTMLVTRIYQISVRTNYFYEKLARNNIERKYYIKPG